MIFYRKLLLSTFIMFFISNVSSFSAVRDTLYLYRPLRAVYQATANVDLSHYSVIKIIPQLDHTVAVTAFINNRVSATFLIDTGASYTVITPELAKKLRLSTKNKDNVVPLNTANGLTYVPLVMIQKIMVGDMSVQNVEAVVTDLGPSGEISGLLGMTFFSGRSIFITPRRLYIGRK